MAPLIRTGGSRHTGLAALPYRNIQFLTAFREYVFRGYEVRALNYLLKPVKENTLFLCLDEIAKELSNNTYIYRNKQEIVSIGFLLFYKIGNTKMNTTLFYSFFCVIILMIVETIKNLMRHFK